MSIPMKQWRYQEALKHGVAETTIATWITRGKYPNLSVKRINKRVVFVELPSCENGDGI